MHSPQRPPAHARRSARPVGAVSLALAVTLVASAARPREAIACGGCFSSSTVTGASTAQVVTDHRMVLSLAGRQTTLWDQFRYSGSPDEFVWILPVRSMTGVRVGVADNNFVDAVDRATAPFVRANVVCVNGVATVGNSLPPMGSGSSGGSFGSSSSGGCGGGTLSYVPSNGSDGMPRAGVDSQVTSMASEASVGPYAVTLVSPQSGGMGLAQWLDANGLRIPPNARDAVDAYTAASYGFVAVRLRPGAGVQQMQPIRVTVPGYQPVLPLRLVAAGVADKVGLVLLVLAPSRVAAENFANARVPESALSYDFATGRSNYAEVLAGVLRGSPPSWVTESAIVAANTDMEYESSIPDAGPPPEMEMGLPGGEDPDGFDAGAGAEPDAESAPPMTTGPDEIDAGAGPDASPMEELMADPYIDRRVAFSALPYSVVVTRLRTSLPASELSRDLTVTASTGGPIGNEYEAAAATNVMCPPPPPAPTATAGSSSGGGRGGGCVCSAVPISGGALSAWVFGGVVLAHARRRRRRR